MGSQRVGQDVVVIQLLNCIWKTSKHVENSLEQMSYIIYHINFQSKKKKKKKKKSQNTYKWKKKELND